MGLIYPVIAEGQYFDSVNQASKKLHICNKYIHRRCLSENYKNYYYTKYRIPEVKTCSTCREVKALSEFFNNKNTRDLKSTDCKKCSIKASCLNRKNNPSTTKDAVLRRTYNISLIQYNSMFAEQKGNCDICGTHQSDLHKALVVDHDHTTGEIRGLLCSACNLGIGNLKDDIDLLLNSIVYLKKYNKHD